MLSQVCVFVCPQGKVVGNIECMVGYCPGKSKVEYPASPPGHQTLGRPCSDIWWWPLKPYGFQESASYWNVFLFFYALLFFSTTGFFPGDTSGYMSLLGGGIQGGEYQWALGYPGGVGGLWYLEVGYTPSLPDYFRVGTHPAPTFRRK